MITLQTFDNAPFRSRGCLQSDSTSVRIQMEEVMVLKAYTRLCSQPSAFPHNLLPDQHRNFGGGGREKGREENEGTRKAKRSQNQVA